MEYYYGNNIIGPFGKVEVTPNKTTFTVESPTFTFTSPAINPFSGTIPAVTDMPYFNTDNLPNMYINALNLAPALYPPYIPYLGPQKTEVTGFGTGVPEWNPYAMQNYMAGNVFGTAASIGASPFLKKWAESVRDKKKNKKGGGMNNYDSSSLDFHSGGADTPPNPPPNPPPNDELVTTTTVSSAYVETEEEKRKKKSITIYSPFLSPTYSFISPVSPFGRVPLPPQLDLNNSSRVRNELVKYFRFKVLDKWLYDEMDDLLNFFTVTSNGVRLSSGGSSKRLSESEEEDISDYIGRYILTEDTMYKILNRIAEEGHINWYQMSKPANERDICTIIHSRLLKSLKEVVGKKTQKRSSRKSRR